MLNKKVQEAINEQIKHELYSAYLYLSMAAYSEAANLPGFARWMRLQAEEETEHALKFFDHVADRGGRVVLQAIEQPPSDFGSPTAMFEQVLQHERKVTALINHVYEVALKGNDYPAQVLLQWYINEQVEEEKNASYIVDTLKTIGEKGHGLVMLDRELGKREE